MARYGKVCPSVVWYDMVRNGIASDGNGDQNVNVNENETEETLSLVQRLDLPLAAHHSLTLLTPSVPPPSCPPLI